MMIPSLKLNYDMIDDRGFDSVHHHGMLSLSIIETPVLALGTGLFGLFSLVSADSGDMVGAVGFGVITVGLASATAYFPHLAYVHSTKDRCQNKVDKLCEKLVEKLNKKIEDKYKLLGY